MQCFFFLFFRQRKLQETLLAVQQLDSSMANLRKWLASIEHDLSTPIIYRECSLLEIQQNLQHQQVREITLPTQDFLEEIY